MKDLGLTPPAASTELDKKIAAGLERLYMFQHEDGGWGWWQTDETHPFMTAYVVAGLAQAKEAGYPIDEQRLKQGRESLLQADQGKSPRPRGHSRLHGLRPGLERRRGPRAGGRTLYPAREKFSAHGQALMALLLMQLKDPRAQEFVKLLEAARKVRRPFVSWKSERQEMLDFSSDNSFETTAYALKALANLDPKSDLLPRGALADGAPLRRLLLGLHRADRDRHLRLDRLPENFRRAEAELHAHRLPERPETCRRATLRKKTWQPASHRADGAPPHVHAGANEVRIVKIGPGVLYWSASASYFSREPKPAPAGSYALNVVREYFKLAPERHSESHCLFRAAVERIRSRAATWSWCA